MNNELCVGFERMCLQCIKETIEDKVKLYPAQTDFMCKFNPAGAETVGWGRGGGNNNTNQKCSQPLIFAA